MPCRWVHPKQMPCRWVHPKQMPCRWAHPKQMPCRWAVFPLVCNLQCGVARLALFCKNYEKKDRLTCFVSSLSECSRFAWSPPDGATVAGADIRRKEERRGRDSRVPAAEGRRSRLHPRRKGCVPTGGGLHCGLMRRYHLRGMSSDRREVFVLFGIAAKSDRIYLLRFEENGQTFLTDFTSISIGYSNK